MVQELHEESAQLILLAVDNSKIPRSFNIFYNGFCMINFNLEIS